MALVIGSCFSARSSAARVTTRSFHGVDEGVEVGESGVELGLERVHDFAGGRITASVELVSMIPAGAIDEGRSARRPLTSGVAFRRLEPASHSMRLGVLPLLSVFDFLDGFVEFLFGFMKL
jgi:hypothetical protein